MGSQNKPVEAIWMDTRGQLRKQRTPKLSVSRPGNAAKLMSASQHVVVLDGVDYEQIAITNEQDERKTCKWGITIGCVLLSDTHKLS